jgi:TctA family transporter
VLGVIAYFLEENDFPIAPAILGLVLGGLLEESFMTSMIKADGDLMAFFERPVAATLGVVTILIWLSPQLARMWRRIRRSRPLVPRR